MRILIDARRQINSGVGRVSQWLNQHVSQIIPGARYFHLVRDMDAVHAYALNPRDCVLADVAPFSGAELQELVKVVDPQRFDLYINPQTTWSPFHRVPSLCVIHDVWGLPHPEWLPTQADLCARFGIADMGYFEGIEAWLTPERAACMLTPQGKLMHQRVLDSGHLIWRAAWAQCAATVHQAAGVVAVSEPVKAQLQEWFVRADRIRVIENIPHGFDDVSGGGPKRHFLTLSKLESRKNLELLLDAYVLLADQLRGRPVPALLIAGDAGYRERAALLAQRVHELQMRGYAVHLLDAVGDARLGELMAQACALVFPSHFEGFGLPPLEAMLSGVPVIATRTGMMQTALGEHAVLFDGADARSLARAMHDTLARGRDAASLERARQAVQAHIAALQPQVRWKEAIEEACGPVDLAR